MEDLFNLQSQLEFVDRYLELAEQPTYTPVELFYSSLHRRDWTFTYSDDGSVVRAGYKHLKELQAQFTTLCQTGAISPSDIELTKPLLNEFVPDIEPATLARIKELEGKFPTIKVNLCHKLIELGQPPIKTRLLRRIHNAFIILPELLKNVGSTRGRDMFVYSPYMIAPRNLNHTVYNGTYGKIMYGHVAISKKAEEAIYDLFHGFNTKEIEEYLYTTLYSYIPGVDLRNVDMNDGTFKRHLVVGKALIALPPYTAEFVKPEVSIMEQLYRRTVTQETMYIVKLYRECLITRIELENAIHNTVRNSGNSNSSFVPALNKGIDSW